MKFLLGLAMACLVFASCKTGGTGSSEGELSASRERGEDPSWAVLRCTSERGDIVWFEALRTNSAVKPRVMLANSNRKTELTVTKFEAKNRKTMDWRVEATEVIDGGGFSPGLKVPYKFEITNGGIKGPYTMDMFMKESPSDPQWDPKGEDQPCTPLT